MKQMPIVSGVGGRLVVALVGAIAVAMLALAAVVPRVASANLLAALEDQLSAQALLIATTISSDPDSVDLDSLAKRIGRQTKSSITIIALDGAVLGESHPEVAQSGSQAGWPEVQQALASGRGVDLRHSGAGGSETLYVAVPIQHDGVAAGIVRVAMPLADIDRQSTALTQVILLAAVAAILVTIVVAVFAARSIAMPLAELGRMVSAFGANPLASSLSRRLDGPVEVARLGDTFERTAAGLRERLRRVAAERDQLEAVLANMADPVAMVDGGGRVALLNAAAERLLGVTNVVAAGRTIAEVLRDHELIEFVEQARSGGKPVDRIMEWRDPRRLLRVSVGRFGSGELCRTLLVLHDLTELRRLETIRRDFVANVSHELRTPIAAIKAMTETLQDGAVADPNAARDFLARIAQEVDGMHRMVEELLELSRLESGRVDIVLAPIDPVPLVQTVIERLAAMAERASVSLTVDMAPGLPPVMADAERMGQVLVNLIHNAIKFTPQGGRIVVRATAETEHVRLSVVDTGVGIAPDLLPRIFERFYKADQARAGGGTGLGLAIAKHTVQLHSGQIWAESQGPGRGTTVHVRLPRARA